MDWLDCVSRWKERRGAKKRQPAGEEVWWQKNRHTETWQLMRHSYVAAATSGETSEKCSTAKHVMWPARRSIPVALIWLEMEDGVNEISSRLSVVRGQRSAAEGQWIGQVLTSESFDLNVQSVKLQIWSLELQNRTDRSCVSVSDLHSFSLSVSFFHISSCLGASW